MVDHRMSAQLNANVHSWLKKVSAAFCLNAGNPLLDAVAANLQKQFRALGHTILAQPEGELDLLVTSATVNQPVDWRESLFFTARRRFGLDHNPTLFTLLQMARGTFEALLDHFREALTRETLNPDDFNFPGLLSNAYETLYEQGRRAGPILAVARLLQAQAKSIRILLVIGEKEPEEAYTFDLVGAHPRTEANNPERFYEDLVLRMVTAVSTQGAANHEIVGEPISQEVWQSLQTPAAMQRAGLELGKRDFFTPMVEVGSLVSIPRFNDAIASQYSEGCFATWEPKIDALVTTITGSARPVEKECLSDDELAIICGVRPDYSGAQIRLVTGKRNDPPSSEAMELIGMDLRLPKIHLKTDWGFIDAVPVARSKLHGHRGVKAYDPDLVEHIFLDPAYYHYPVSCSTDAQARAIMDAFSRSESLIHPEDQRQLIFSILPGHGLVLVEKWVDGKQPFQMTWEAMDNGTLEIDSRIPQGPFSYRPDRQGRLVLR